eukprot:m.215689 g.215689  ORF g.215689 m.215689 type:complete len:359 (+) comp28001_c0_seq1:157-1233(+)
MISLSVSSLDITTMHARWRRLVLVAVTAVVVLGFVHTGWVWTGGQPALGRMGTAQGPPPPPSPPPSPLPPLPDTVHLGASDRARHCTVTDLAGRPVAGAAGWLDQRWVPNKCMTAPLFDPSQPENRVALAQCLEEGNVTLVLIGDSRIRQLYFYLQASLSVPRLSFDQVSFKSHSDLNCTVPLSGDDALHRGPRQLSILFHWEPKLTSERVASLLLHAGTRLDGSQGPALVVMGAGLWELKAEVGRPELDKALQALHGPMQAAARRPGVQLYWIPMGAVIWDMLVKPRQTITNANISWTDDRARTHLGGTATFLEQVIAIYQGTGPEGTADGLHFSEKIQQAIWDIIMNHYCQTKKPL